MNVIPADTRNKKTDEQWGQWQDKPIPQESHEHWKRTNAFKDGMAVILGRIWHRKDKQGYHLIGVDCDNERAIRELCTRNGKTISVEDFGLKTLVEQHKDDVNKAHWYFYSPRPLVKKGSDAGKNMDLDENPAIEVKGEGAHGIMFCAPSPHKNGHNYEIIGTSEPAILSLQQAEELELHINTIWTETGLPHSKCL